MDPWIYPHSDVLVQSINPDDLGDARANNPQALKKKLLGYVGCAWYRIKHPRMSLD
jgi:hypothetical protein